ncbi:hypothetical protein ID866_8352 [Astraeus odoratus]|nr:hypothetical protein ID866_8352 [Astraeus odoratus]
MNFITADSIFCTYPYLTFWKLPVDNPDADCCESHAGALICVGRSIANVVFDTWSAMLWTIRTICCVASVTVTA